jgi:ABC-type branched-subunit amino acid transport system permease subunit
VVFFVGFLVVASASPLELGVVGLPELLVVVFVALGFFVVAAGSTSGTLSTSLSDWQSVL